MNSHSIKISPTLIKGFFLYKKNYVPKQSIEDMGMNLNSLRNESLYKYI